MTDVQALLQEEIIKTTGKDLLPAQTLAGFRQNLAACINNLINQNFEKLISILYRLDVNEKVLKTSITENKNEDAGFLIADAIIERQMQKMESRKKFYNHSKDIPEDESW
jgi:hypothetical protein